MDSKKFSEKRIKELSEKPVSEFIELFNQLPDSSIRGLRSKGLPKATKKGFRPHTREVFVEQIKRALNKAQNTRDGWRYLRNMWVHWVVDVPCRIPDGKSLQDILLDIDNSADNPGKEDEVPPNSDLDIQCFKILKEKNADGLIDRSTIETFYDFGYFERDERIEEIIDSCKSRSELLILTLGWSRIEELTEDIAELSNSIQELSNLTEDQDQRLSEALKSVQENRKLVSENSKRDNQLRKKFDERNFRKLWI